MCRNLRNRFISSFLFFFYYNDDSTLCYRSASTYLYFFDGTTAVRPGSRHRAGQGINRQQDIAFMDIGTHRNDTGHGTSDNCRIRDICSQYRCCSQCTHNAQRQQYFFSSGT